MTTVLFIGGTGIISSACARQLALRGDSLTLMCRGQTERPVPPGVEILRGNVRDPVWVNHALEGRTFDVVVDWVAYTPAHVEHDVALFSGRAGQYVFISSASAYQTPPASLPVTESTPLSNPYWAYSRDKIACEELLLRAHRERGFVVTIVRPSHTYDCRTLPFHGGYAVVARMRQGNPVIVHGDGTSLWVMTHHEDFAKGFNGLLGNPQAFGEAFHITSDEVLTWNQLHELVADAAGVEPKLVHLPSDLIARVDPDWGASLLGDKAHSMIFDNSKIKRVVPTFSASIPFRRGAQEIIAYYDADPRRRLVDPGFDAVTERLLSVWQRAVDATA
jgi:nucleoside-diphosphate-sugar epimerase